MPAAPPRMDPVAAPTAATSAPTWRRTVRRGSLARDRARAAEREELGRRRAEELEEAVSRLRAELEKERAAAETAASEAMAMIARLQREKAAAMIEAREFRRIAEARAGRDRLLQDQLAAVSALAASYQALLRAHGIDPDQEERADGSVEAAGVGGDSDDANGVAAEEPPHAPPPPPADEELVECKYPVDVRYAAAAEERRRVAGDVVGDLRARVEADSAAARREVAARRAEHAQVVLALARRLCREAAAARSVVVATERRRCFSVLAVCKWFFSTIMWGAKCSAPATRRLPNPPGSSMTYFLLGLLPNIRSKVAGNGEHGGLPCCERPWCTPL